MKKIVYRDADDTETEPTLPEMVNSALAALMTASQEQGRPYVLVVEASMPDKGSHRNDADIAFTEVDMESARTSAASASLGAIDSDMGLDEALLARKERHVLLAASGIGSEGIDELEGALLHHKGTNQLLKRVAEPGYEADPNYGYREAAIYVSVQVLVAGVVLTAAVVVWRRCKKRGKKASPSMECDATVGSTDDSETEHSLCSVADNDDGNISLPVTESSVSIVEGETGGEFSADVRQTQREEEGEGERGGKDDIWEENETCV
ncbi:alkaline phosphatase [Kipferlia bialata]|uniref:alkaline phosphatase n=1 Tax=Kipferlia bialata TaxID=797122 RepID=A0A9K3D3N3_9EUKA|nr:alkaline phosphatase [Kipferlia bialata]|eukprot:g9464.t1